MFRQTAIDPQNESMSTTVDTGMPSVLHQRQSKEQCVCVLFQKKRKEKQPQLRRPLVGAEPRPIDRSTNRFDFDFDFDFDSINGRASNPRNDHIRNNGPCCRHSDRRRTQTIPASERDTHRERVCERKRDRQGESESERKRKRERGECRRYTGRRL